MLVYNNDLIGPRQLRALLIMDIVGVGAFFLPQTVFAYSGVDSWISVIISLFIALIYGGLIGCVCEKGKNDNFVELSVKAFGGYIGRIVPVIFYIKLIITGGLFLRAFSEIIKTNILDNSILFISFIILAVCAYSCTITFQQRGRLAELLLLFFIIPILLVFVVGCFNGELHNIKPILTEGKLGTLKGGFYASFYFMPLELLLLSTEGLKNINVKRNTLYCIAFIGIVLCFVTLVLVMRFGITDLKRQIFPVLEMIYIIELPGAFIERLEAVVMIFLMLGMFFIIHSFLFYSNKLACNIVHIKTHWYTVLGSTILIYCVSCIPKDVISSMDALFTVLKYGGVAFMIILPIALLLCLGGKRLEKN